jgi:photosystem II stability/assembly factor-like uncharacterized protein
VRVSSPLTRTLVVVFLMVDAVLGVLAWQHVSASRSSAASTGGSIEAPGAEPSVNLPAGTGANNVQTLDPANATMLDASTGGVVIRASAGNCDGNAPSVLVSTDGGKNFAPTKPDVSQVLAVNVRTSGTLDIVGADDDCKPIGLTSDDDGETWDDSSVITGWYRDPESATGIIRGTATADVGCDVIALSEVNPTVVWVSCADGTVRSTDDAGTTWTTLDGIKAVRSLSFDSSTEGVALVQTDDCAASVFRTADAGETWDQRGCITGQTGHGILDQDSRMLAAVDATVSESTDGGSTWEPAGGTETASASPSPTTS